MSFSQVLSKNLYFIGRKLLYNVVLLSAIHVKHPEVHTYPLPVEPASLPTPVMEAA